jgi:hypothetical protein
MCGLHARTVGWEVLEPSSAVLQAAATPSQLPAQTRIREQKNPMSLPLVTSGSKKIPRRLDRVTSANRSWAYSPDAERSSLSRVVHR